MNKLNRGPVFSPPKDDGNSRGAESSKVEEILNADNMLYLTARQLTRSLVGAMRESGIHKVSVFAYEGRTENAVGELVAEYSFDEETRRHILKLYDPEKPEELITLFKPRPMHGRSRQRRVHTKKTLSSWLSELPRNDGADILKTHNVTFTAFPFVEESDESGQTKDLQEAVRTGEEVMPGVVEVGAEKGTQEDADAQKAKPRTKRPKLKKNKRLRKAKRRKKTKGEIKKRKQESAESSYKEMMQDTLDTINEIFTAVGEIDYSYLDAFIPALMPLARFLNTNPDFKKRCKEELRSNSKYSPIVISMSILANEKIQNKIRGMIKSSLMQKASGQNAPNKDISEILKLARELYPQSKHSPDRSRESEYMLYEDMSNFPRYVSGLFFDATDPISLFQKLGSANRERWLDIGAGRTPGRPDSFINIMSFINPNVQIAATDIAYGANRTAADKLRELESGTGFNKDLFDQHEKHPYSAQRLGFESSSFDRILSAWTFYFIEEPHSLAQSFLQVARVLKPGGEARISPVLKDVYEHPDVQKVITEYFNVKHQEEDNGGKNIRLVLERKMFSSGALRAVLEKIAPDRLANVPRDERYEELETLTEKWIDEHPE